MLSVRSEHTELVTSQLTRYGAVSTTGTLLLIEFTTLSDYLHYLQGAAQSLAYCGGLAMLFLAAAVSDFYIPSSDMASNFDSMEQFLRCGCGHCVHSILHSCSVVHSKLA